MPYRSPRAIYVFHWLKATVLVLCGVGMIWLWATDIAPVATEMVEPTAVSEPVAAVMSATPSPTSQPTATQTAVPTSAATALPEPTATPTSEPIPPTPTLTATATAVATSVASPTGTATAEPTAVPAPLGDIAILYPPDGAQLAGFELTMVGTAPPQAAVRIWHNGEEVGLVTADEFGYWSHLRLRVTPPQEFVLAAELVGEGAAVEASHTITLNLPAISPPCESPIPGLDLGQRYIVGTCEWMTRIARTTGVDFFELVALNPQIADPNNLRPGQVLFLPER
jgi:hypothetical protein